MMTASLKKNYNLYTIVNNGSKQTLKILRMGVSVNLLTHFLAHPVEPRDRWVQTHATVG